ncbi:hypothetical protein COK06_27340 [Bacillus cereus]|nr:hypothetical protein CON40_28710 [Bacillus cereus]PEV96084.1 hypothetical protein CN428_27775 [Bacillus cereus]PFE51759.1 hypothetical protein CN318_26765 [Bacillus cereus]PFP87614.1 hypothetical protein COK06_27340 [Bacillus cereus]PFQ64904.1 hypothetical protein COK21_21305 [Bacillus cereus]
MTLFIFLYIPILTWVLGFSFVTGLSEKLYKILHALSVGFVRNAGGTSSCPHQNRHHGFSFSFAAATSSRNPCIIIFVKNYELIDEMLDYYIANKLNSNEQNNLNDIISIRK